MPHGLNMPRKKAEWTAKIPKRVPQGLKPVLLLMHLRPG